MVKDRVQHPNKFVQTLKHQRVGIVLVFFLSGLTNLLMLTGSLYMIQVYDRVLASGSYVTLLGLFTIVVLLYLFFGIFDLLRRRLMSRVSVRVDLALGGDCFKELIGTDPDSTQVNGSVLHQLAALRHLLSGPSILCLLDAIFAPLFLIALFVIHPWLGLMVLAGAAITVLISVMSHFMTRNWRRKSELQDQALLGFSSRSLAMSEMLAAMHMKADVRRHWQHAQRTSLTLHQQMHGPAEALSSANKTIRMLLQSSILTVGAVFVMQGQISAGMIIASTILTGRVLAPIDQMIGSWATIAKAVAAIGKLHAHFKVQDPERPRIDLPALRGRVSFRDVTVANLAPADVNSPLLLKDATFEIEPADGVCLFGGPGAGKSTLVKTMLGIVKPTQGSVTLDQAHIAQWGSKDLQNSIGFLPQIPLLLPATIRQNITRFNAAATDADAIAAAQLAGIHEWILSLPEGYASKVGGGAGDPYPQRYIYRLCLARALIFRPALVILDEPGANSAGSPDEEPLIETIITKLRASGSTVIVTSRRPYAISSVNKAMIIEGGRIIRYDTTQAIFGKTYPARIIPKARKLSAAK